MVRSRVSCSGAFLTIAHALFQKQNTWHPRMCIRCKNRIVRYLGWISSSAALVRTL